MRRELDHMNLVLGDPRIDGQGLCFLHGQLDGFTMRGDRRVRLLGDDADVVFEHRTRMGDEDVACLHVRQRAGILVEGAGILGGGHGTQSEASRAAAMFSPARLPSFSRHCEHSRVPGAVPCRGCRRHRYQLRPDVSDETARAQGPCSTTRMSSHRPDDASDVLRRPQDTQQDQEHNMESEGQPVDFRNIQILDLEIKK